MCKSKITRYEQIELRILTGAPTKVMFPDTANLRNQADQKITIKFIEVITAAVLAVTPNGSPNAALAELQKAVLVLYVTGKESIYRIPLLKLNRVHDYVSPYQPEGQDLDDLQAVDWSKSYVQFSSAPNAAVPYTILFGVSYLLHAIPS